MTKAVDAVPVKLQAQFIKLMSDKAKFWGDMMTLCSEFGLRNIECRELRADHVDLNKGILTLSDSKQVRAYITKQANKIVDDQWLKDGRKWLRNNVDDSNISLIVRIAHDTKGLENLADEYDLLEEFRIARESHYKANIDPARAVASKTAPKGRVIDFSRMDKAKRILKARIEQYGELCGWLFPRCELKSNRATGYEPVSRQAVYRMITIVREQMETMGGVFARALEGIRLGLHSCRKSCVQRVVDVMDGDILAASIFIGHGNGSGDLATTQNYLNKSKQRMNEITMKLAQMSGKKNATTSAAI